MKSRLSYEPFDEFIEVTDPIESEEDIGSFKKNQISSAVVYANDWTTETIINQINKGNIQLNPKFQRRDAWDKNRKSRFIESIILGFPIPQIVLAESKSKKGSYIVLDGKQRLLTIRQFASEKTDQLYQPLKLQNLEIRSDLNGLSHMDLKEDIQFSTELSCFENQPIRTVVLRNWVDEGFLYHVFLRLNTGSVSLSPQELRQALHPGPFLEFLDKASAESLALQSILKNKKPDFRMRDAEILLRYFAFQYDLSNYKGVLKKFLDDFCQHCNKEWHCIEPQLINSLRIFESAHSAIEEAFGKNAVYRKWTGKSFETRFNRAIFDVLHFYLNSDAMVSQFRALKSKIVDEFCALCETDPDFLSAIETTTKSISSVVKRLEAWGTIFQRLTKINLRIPEERSGKIFY